MIVPIKTDAPIYYLPFATIAMIVLNVVVFCVMVSMNESDYKETIKATALLYGHFRPWTWVTSNFVHGGFMHLISNMVTLWTFGLIVEGKVGWWRFLLIYLGIGFIQCGCEQVLTMGFGRGASFGASAIIFGLIAIAMIWAPANEMTCFFWGGVFSFTFEAPVYTVAAILVLMELGVSIFSLGHIHQGNFALAITSSTLHLMGAALGFAVGIVMLKMKWVDCENWDIFSVRAEKHRGDRDRDMNVEAELKRIKNAPVIPTMSPESALAAIREKIASRSPGEALMLRKEARRGLLDWELPEAELLQLSDMAMKQQRWPDVADLWSGYLAKYSSRAAAIRVRLAGIYVEHLKSARKALKLLDEVPAEHLAGGERKLYDRIRANVEKEIEDDPYALSE